MRLTRKKTIEKAKAELLRILGAHPEGVCTGDLVGTAEFHGVRTLTHYQIRKLLRATGMVTEETVGYGIRTSTLWRLKQREAAGVGKMPEAQA